MIPSLLQIPSAVSDSKLHSVLPNNGKGDFTFDRSTGATRINRDGLIEEVGYFSSELVQNGNFSELGSEIIVNGDFATNSNWNLGTGWTINNGKLRGDNVSAINVFQAKVYASGKTYKVTYTVSDYVKGTVRFQIGGGGSTVDGQTRTANGTYTEFLTATSNHTSARFRGLSASGGFTGSIDNVSVKQVDPNDRWIKGSGWSYGNNKILGSNTNTFDTIVQDISELSGKEVKLTFDIVDYTSGTFRLFPSDRQDGLDQRYSGNGSYQVIYTPTVNNLRFQQQNFVGAVTNISLVEVQGDRPRLSYDITNGVVEDKPHLLLEPSSTNLVTFSEDFSQSVWNNFASITPIANSIISPDGLKNASTLACSGNNVFRYAFTASSTTNYVGSVFVKAKETTNDFGIQTLESGTAYKSVFNIESGVVVTQASNHTASIEDFGNGWFRCSVKFNSGSSTSNIFDFTGSQTTDIKEFYAWGAMLEQQTYATSYIPTAGTTITRVAETCNNSKPSVNSTEGVLYAEIQALASNSTAKEITISDGTTNNRVIISYNTANQIRINYRNSSSNIFDQSNSSTITDFHKIAVKWKVNDFSFYLDGSQVASSTSGSVMSANTLTTASFDDGAGGFDFYGKVKGLAVYNEALSESQLMQLTGVTASSIYNNFVTRTASFTVEALNEVKKVIDNL